MKSALAVILTFSSLQAFANDDMSWSTSAPFVLSGAYSTSLTNSRRCGYWTCNDKIIMAAKDDAAIFIASEGAIRGLNFETALEYIHNTQPDLQSSDADLAAAILNF